MNIQPTYCSYEQSKLLKEKGFDENCRMLINGAYEPHHLNLTETILQRNSEILESCYSIPEQWQVTEWLRVNHGIWIHSAPENNEEDIVKWAFTIQRIDSEVRFVRRVGEFNSPQEAYSAAFDYILKELI